MKKYLLIIAVVLSALAPFQIQAQAVKYMGVKGIDIIGPDGKPFLMRGSNLGNWLIPEGYMFKFKSINSPKLINEAFMEIMGPEETKSFWKKYLDAYITEADIHFLKSTGMNSIRIPFSYRLFTNEDYLGENNPNHGFELLDKVIGWCKKEKIYVILDMHCAPGGQTGDNIDDGYGYPFLFKSETSKQLTIKIWTRIANHYKNEPIILGYDLLNEPIAHYFDKKELNPYLEPLYKRITEAVRTVDKNHIVILGGAQWDSDLSLFGKPFDSKLVYTFHKYWTPTTIDQIQDYLNFRNKYNVPIYCGETGENNDQWILEFRTLLEKNNIGWHFWPYKKMENKAGISSFSMPDNYEKVIGYTEKPRSSFEDIRKATPENREQMKASIYAILNNCKFENCTPNKGYIEGLGLKLK
jgi:endoglucanase